MDGKALSSRISRRSALTAGAVGTALVTTGAAAAEEAGGVLADPLAAITAMAVRFDRREWEPLREVFTTEVHLDYTGLSGGEPGPVRADDLVETWRRNLSHLDATQHLLTNHVVHVRGGQATATADFQATHRLGPRVGGRLWVLGGSYEYTLVRVGRGWRISGVTMRPTWETGDRTVIGLPSQE